jgi:hypothetical protein
MKHARVLNALVVLPIALGAQTPTPAARPPGSGRSSIRARDFILFVTDLADHYSQIANYMRLMGMIPPSALPRTHH